MGACGPPLLCGSYNPGLAGERWERWGELHGGTWKEAGAPQSLVHLCSPQCPESRALVVSGGTRMAKHILLLSHVGIHEEENRTGSTRRNRNRLSPPYKLKVQEINAEDKVKSHSQDSSLGCSHFWGNRTRIRPSCVPVIT